jgi:hypothetical protein
VMWAVCPVTYSHQRFMYSHYQSLRLANKERSQNNRARSWPRQSRHPRRSSSDHPSLAPNNHLYNRTICYQSDPQWLNLTIIQAQQQQVGAVIVVLVLQSGHAFGVVVQTVKVGLPRFNQSVTPNEEQIGMQSVPDQAEG